MLKLALINLLAATALGSVVGTRQVNSGDPTRYTICGQDRGYTEKDSLEAAATLENKIVTSDHFFIQKEDCIFAHVNTTIVSLCNGIYRDRHINRAEVRRGINQLIQDCGLEGGFTGIHVVNNLTFAAYGVFGGINLARPSGSNPPTVPGGGSRKRRSLSKRADDCNLGFDGSEKTNCNFKYKLNEDGSCGDYKNLENGCQQFCEQKRMGLLGVETSAPEKGGTPTPVTTKVELSKGQEISISNGFSIGVEGTFKDVVGAGLSYEHTITTSKSYTVTLTSSDDDYTQLTEEEKKQTWARWVYFPKLIKSCGTVSKSGKTTGSPPACGTSVCPPAAPKCGSTEERTENVCIMSPELDSAGEATVIWALRLETRDGKALPIEKQTASYKNACRESADPDNDGEKECLNDNPSRRGVDLAAMKREYERGLARAAAISA